ncbi:MAG: elongation factor Ts [Candidatus Melainabacteria bacterium]|nr:elongation factor Ts [Candidatus Melainabacteria bacterium]
MVDISASMVKELRERSGAAMMDCKKALVESQGDFEKAFEWLRQKGVAVASKKALRAASEGLIVGAVSQDGQVGVLMEINCETDYVARNAEFSELTQQIASTALKHKPHSTEALLNLQCGACTVANVITEKVARTGENILIRRLTVYDLSGREGTIGLYVHALGGKMGALLELTSNSQVSQDNIMPLAKEIAMHVVSAKPQYLSRSDVPSDVLANEKRIESGKVDLKDKKPEIQDKIIAGRVDKLLAEKCLLEQPFVKDPSITIGQYLVQKGSSWGAELKPTRFQLFILGEAPEGGDNSDNITS